MNSGRGSLLIKPSQPARNYVAQRQHPLRSCASMPSLGSHLLATACLSQISTRPVQASVQLKHKSLGVSRARPTRLCSSQLPMYSRLTCGVKAFHRSEDTLTCLWIPLSPTLRHTQQQRWRAGGQRKGGQFVLCAAPTNGEYAEHTAAAVEVVERAMRLCWNVRREASAREPQAPGAPAEQPEPSPIAKLSKESSVQVQKSDRTPVTVADFGVQAVVSWALEEAFPAVPLVAEEDSQELTAPGAEPLLQAVLAAVRAVYPGGGMDTKEVLEAVDRGSHPGSRGTYWVLDPIDGTRGFIRGGSSQYVIGLALVVDGVPRVGVMGLPNWSAGPASQGASSGAGVLIAAEHGEGAWWCSAAGGSEEAGSSARGAAGGSGGGAGRQWRRARVHPAARPEDAVMCVSDHEDWQELPLSQVVQLGAPAEQVVGLCCGSLCKYAAVALGQASAFLQHPVPAVPRLKVWDHAAGVVCVEEAGGRVTDLQGQALDLAAREFAPGGLGVLACSAPLHSPLVAALAQVAGPLAVMEQAAQSGSVRADGYEDAIAGEQASQEGHAARFRETLPASLAGALVLLDRDGVLNRDLGRWVQSPEELDVYASAGPCVAALNRAGAHVALVTNQSCVGRGLISEGRLADIHAKLQRQLAAAGGRLDRVYVATSPPGELSILRKPAPGMVLQALEDFAVEAEAALIVGDSLTDLKAGAAAGVQCRVLVLTGHGTDAFGPHFDPSQYTFPLLVTHETKDEFFGASFHLPTFQCIFPFTVFRTFSEAAEGILEAFP